MVCTKSTNARLMVPFITLGGLDRLVPKCLPSSHRIVSAAQRRTLGLTSTSKRRFNRVKNRTSVFHPLFIQESSFPNRRFGASLSEHKARRRKGLRSYQRVCVGPLSGPSFARCTHPGGVTRRTLDVNMKWYYNK